MDGQAVLVRHHPGDVAVLEPVVDGLQVVHIMDRNVLAAPRKVRVVAGQAPR